jgi:hypothetical protein
MAEENEAMDTQPEETLADFFGPLQSLLNTLEPPDRVAITDTMGNVYDCSGVLAARAQIKVFQTLRLIGGIEADVSGIDSYSDLLGVVMSALDNEELLNAVNRAFAIAHPGALKAAAKASGEFAEPIDLFPVEEIVRGLLPFAVRLVTRVGTLVIAMKGQATQ